MKNLQLHQKCFGAYGDNIHDDHNALINTFKYAYNNRIELDANNYSSIPIKFNSKKYLNGSTIVFDSSTTLANNIVIFGNGAFVTGNGLKFTQNAGWKLCIKDLKMASMTTAFEFEERNLEYGNFVFDHLEFINVENPIIMNRRSCLVDIKNCIFRAVSSIGEFTNVDRLYFHENWIEPISTISNLDYFSMLKQNSGEEGSMFIYNNLFVPVGGNNSKELCWIEVNKHARIYNNRFGGENTNYHPLRVGSGFITNNISSPHPYLSFDHNDEVVGNTSIIIENVCGTMLFTDNQGYNSGGKIIEWSDKVSEEQQTTIIEQQANMLNLVISNNNGRNLYRNGNGNGVATVYLPTIPTNLYGVCNRGMRSTTERTGENRAYLDYLEPTQGKTQTITIKKQPFDNISSASLGGRFAFVSSFAIMCWCGFGYSTNYECKTTYMLITFSLNETTLRIAKNFIGEELDIDVSFSNDTNTIDVTTLNNVSDLEIKIFSTTNKVLKFIKAQIFRPHNELTSFM